jgi:hypothetical protein
MSFWCSLCERGSAEEIVDKWHTKESCQEREIMWLKYKLRKAEDRANQFVDAWYDLRKIIGYDWWHHPAIDNDEKREYFQNNLK